MENFILQLKIEVFDRELLLNYVKLHAEELGFDKNYQFSLEEAVYEAIILNKPKNGIISVGLMIKNQIVKKS